MGETTKGGLDTAGCVPTEAEPWPGGYVQAYTLSKANGELLALEMKECKWVGIKCLRVDLSHPGGVYYLRLVTKTPRVRGLRLDLRNHTCPSIHLKVSGDRQRSGSLFIRLIPSRSME